MSWFLCCEQELHRAGMFFFFFFKTLVKRDHRHPHSHEKQTNKQHTDKDSSLDYPNTFKIKGRRFELIFAAKSALEEQSWIDCIRNVIKESRSY